ncbi:MAG: hypothetical protein CMM96_05825 [Rickettsiales bacterium]|nr:hypothetical protein [Rickettsiales bacterium]|tara:strand:- start:404 stop:628 length:225 start_codon:yes stop_codon:yes gene_type:complete
MLFPLRKLILAIIFNFCLFSILILGIQNSTRKEKVKFLGNETIKLPISFIIGTSFITGSILGSFSNLGTRKKND